MLEKLRELFSREDRVAHFTQIEERLSFLEGHIELEEDLGGWMPQLNEGLTPRVLIDIRNPSPCPLCGHDLNARFNGHLACSACYWVDWEGPDDKSHN